MSVEKSPSGTERKASSPLSPDVPQEQGNKPKSPSQSPSRSPTRSRTQSPPRSPSRSPPRSPARTPPQTGPVIVTASSAVGSTVHRHGSRSPSLSLILDEMQREQARDTRRIIIGSALTLGSVGFIVLVLIVWLLSPNPHAKPTTIADKTSKRAAVVTFGPPAYRLHNASRFGVGEQNEEASDDNK